jgi:hypothetical protein
MKKVMLLLLFIFTYTFAFATSLILAIHKNIIYVSIDSKVGVKRHNYKNTKQVDTIYRTGCKIRHFGNYFLTGTGILSDRIASSVEPILLRSTDFNSSLNSMENAISNGLISYIESDRLNSREYYLQSYSHVNGFASTVFCCFENGIAIVYIVRISLNNKPNESVKLKFVIDKMKESNDVILLGESKAASSAMKDPHFFTGKAIEERLSHLIELEIKDKPKAVGYPVTVLEIMNNGIPIWYKKGVCNP